MVANQSKMAIVSPCHDTANQWVHNWMEPHLVPLLDEWSLHKHYCEEARGPSHIYPSMETHHPKGLFEHGHGTPHTILGDNTYAIWFIYGEGLQYLPLLEDKIIYFISCHTGALLGPRMVSEYNVRAYIGYDDSCYMGGSSYWRECLLQPWYALIEGCTVGEAYQRCYDKYTEVSGGSHPYLLHNRDHLVVYGDLDAKLIENTGTDVITDTSNLTINVV